MCFVGAGLHNSAGLSASRPPRYASASRRAVRTPVCSGISFSPWPTMTLAVVAALVSARREQVPVCARLDFENIIPHLRFALEQLFQFGDFIGNLRRKLSPWRH
jgi:hypothetical protein